MIKFKSLVCNTIGLWAKLSHWSHLELKCYTYLIFLYLFFGNLYLKSNLPILTRRNIYIIFNCLILFIFYLLRFFIYDLIVVHSFDKAPKLYPHFITLVENNLITSIEFTHKWVKNYVFNFFQWIILITTLSLS